jgi:anti-sigma factor RsiW
MTCPEIDDRLDDYVDGTLPEGEFQEVELHLASCPACRDEERRLRSILAQAHALPREVAPGRDLWAGIAERIQEERRARRRGWATWGLAAAAVLVVGVSLRVLHSVDPAARPAPPAVGTTPAALEATSIGAAEQDYQQAATALLAALQERRQTLSPEALASVEKNLVAIDQALDEVRAALGRDPGNPELTRMLVSTHRKKVETLRRVVRLSTAL